MYRQLTRRDELEAVRRGLRTAIQKGRMQIKINCVPVLGIEEQKLLEVAELAKNHNVHVRFIEMMPIGMGTQFAFVKEDALKHALEGALEPLPRAGTWQEMARAIISQSLAFRGGSVLSARSAINSVPNAIGSG